MITVEKIMPSVWRQIPGEFLAKVDPDLAQDDWQGLFRMRENQQERHSGYLLRDDSKIVGILGTLFSQRTIDGETQPFCNLHNWFVEETYRGYSLWLMRPVLRLVDHTLTDFTPTEPVARISLKLGFRSLDSRLRILPPFPVPVTRSRGGGLEFHEGLERLSETDTPLLRDNDHGQTGHLLVSQGENSCLIFYSRITRHALSYCYINYLSNKALFERAHLDLRSLLLKRTRSRFCALDDRPCTACGFGPVSGCRSVRDTPWEPLELLSASRLVAWKFDHLVASQTAFSPYVRSLDDSYYMELESGFETYLRERTAASASLKRAASKARKIEREVGPMRFSLENQQREAFEQMLEWKREQLRLMQQVDVYRIDWVREFLERIWTTRTGGFEGLLSTLHAGDQLIAVQLGMRSGPVVSAWIPAFNSKFARYSPGMLLHLELAKRAAKLGVTRIDLGRGENQLKRSLMSGTIPVALGSVDRRFFHRLLTTGWYQLRDLAPQIPGGGLAHRLYRRGRRLIG